MVNSDTDICNLALGYLGQTSIVNRESSGQSAKLCDINYDISRQVVLKDLNASFAIKRAVLATDASFAPVYGYSSAFVLPKDCLKVMNIEDPMRVEMYQIEGKYLYCNYDKEVKIRYIYDCEDVSLYDAEFVELFALKLASKICMSLTQDIEKTNYIERLMRQKYLDASVKYGSDNRLVIVNKPRFRGHRLGVNEDIVR